MPAGAQQRSNFFDGKQMVRETEAMLLDVLGK